MDQTGHGVGLATVPLRVHQQTEPLLKAERLKRGIPQLVFQLCCHGSQLHTPKHIQLLGSADGLQAAVAGDTACVEEHLHNILGDADVHLLTNEV